jgi:hypothetical protein
MNTINKLINPALKTSFASVAEAKADPMKGGLAVVARELNLFASENRMESFYDADMKEVKGVMNVLSAKRFKAIEIEGDILSCPTGRYELNQPSDFYDSVMEAVEPYNPEKIRAFRVDGIMQIEVTLHTFEIDRADRKIDDVMKMGLRFTDSVNSKRSFSVVLFSLRLWCLNGCTEEVEAFMAKHKHTKNLHSRIAMTITALQVAIKELPLMGQRYDEWANKRVTLEERRHLVNVICKVDPVKELEGSIHSKTINKRDKILELSVYGRGNYGETLWDVYNAVSEYESHFRSVNRVDGQTTEETRFYGTARMTGSTSESLTDRAKLAMERALQVEPLSVTL